MSYEIILADPPWSYRDSANAGKRGAVHKYRTLSLPEICALDVPGIAAANCLLALWWVPPMPEEALQVVRSWGFTLKTMKGFTWHKTTKHGKSHFRMGHWTRANTEDCLFAVRGKPKRVNAGVRQVIEAPLGKHSTKPPEVRERLVRLMGDVPRIELFAREAVPGWDVWGLEVESTIELGVQRTDKPRPKGGKRRARVIPWAGTGDFRGKNGQFGAFLAVFLTLVDFCSHVLRASSASRRSTPRERCSRRTTARTARPWKRGG